nr:class IIb bacteriocin, lactobin A/cerein 7B family [uncultured Capnocytophaga sp.]
MYSKENLLSLCNKENNTFITDKSFSPLTKEELECIEGGFLPTLIAIGAAAGAALAIYELGKATGEFIYNTTH